MILHECTDINTSGSGNIYLLELYKHLLANERLSRVYSGSHFLFDQPLRPSVMHLHWPEGLTIHAQPTVKWLDAVERTLKSTKEQGTKLCYTAHNLQKHTGHSENYERLYQLVITHADAIVHFTDYSKAIFCERYGDQPGFAGKKHRVIPHGNFLSYENTFSKSAARKFLAIPAEKKVVLVFGSLRHEAEVDLLLAVFGEWQDPDKYLVVAGKNLSGKPIVAHEQIGVFDWTVSSSHLQIFMNAADTLYIPRIDILNSGLVYLGLSFGKTVVGVNTGGIGEILHRTGNPGFHPGNIPEAVAAIEQAIEQSTTGLGERNIQFIKEKGDWAEIAAMHVDLFEELVGT